MKSFLVFVVLVNFFTNGLAIFGECDIGEEIDYYGNFENQAVKDNVIGIVKVFNATKITKITVADNKYFDAKLENGAITVFVKDGFKEFEFDETSRRNFLLSFKLEVFCETGSMQITFKQPIIDVNNHAPFFNRKEYNYRFGMDVAAGFDLSEMLSILATDVDVSTSSLKFTFDKPNEFLQFSTKRFSDSLAKTFTTGLVAKKALTKMSETFTITVTDDGTPSQTGSAKINLIID